MNIIQNWCISSTGVSKFSINNTYSTPQRLMKGEVIRGRERETLINHTRKKYICGTSHECQGLVKDTQWPISVTFESKVRIETNKSGNKRFIVFNWNSWFDQINEIPMAKTHNQEKTSLNRQPTNFFNEFKTYTIHYYFLSCINT